MLILVGYVVFALLSARSVSLPMLLTGLTISMTVVIMPVYFAGILIGRGARIVADRPPSGDRQRESSSAI
ncbi:hypothetical protein [Mycobacterium lepromatosis]|uniref:hypothetical protein n=1 Tax=Mycobacterium lepromatosis TaxID=480418 RepID=UPI001F25F1F8|nr:hypothetical protein [Mycobacterium lepromatosis]